MERNDTMSEQHISSRIGLALTALALLGALLAGCATAPTGGKGASPTATVPTTASATATASAPAVRYVALGASDAVGVGASGIWGA